MYYTGVNIGGLFSQNKNFSDEYLDNFITENDIKRISNWGFNLIRLPVDYYFFEDDSQPFAYDLKRIKRIDDFITIAGKYNLKIILDFHNVPGFTFEANRLDFNDIWDVNSQNRKRFLKILGFFSDRYKNLSNIIYEILNEPVAPENSQWLELAGESINVIRKNDKNNFTIAESNLWGMAKNFKEMKKFEDDKIIYSFHFYEPILVTHQFAPWVPFYNYYKEKVDYPGKPNNYFESITQIVEKNNRYFANFLKDIDKFWDKNEILKLLKPVLEFRNKHNVPVLCGEFGCIVRADKAVRERWLKDVIDIFKENKISYTYWTYKNMDFGIYDFTEEYKNNENYDVEDRLDSDTLKILQSGIEDSK